MALFEYECPLCDLTTEVVQKFEDPAPECDKHPGTILRRLISVPFRAQIKNGCTGAQLGNR
jgi:putative FmdB family regulatory protein